MEGVWVVLFASGDARGWYMDLECCFEGPGRCWETGDLDTVMLCHDLVAVASVETRST